MNDLAAAWRDAQARGAAGDLDGAEAAYRAIVAMSPQHAPALLQLSYLASLKDRYRDARALALRAAAARPRHPAVVAELLSRLRTFNAGGEFGHAVAALPALAQIPIPALLAIGAQLSYANDQDGALRFLDEAVRGDPDYPPSRVARAQVLIYLGQFDAAYRDLDICLRRAPQIAQAWWLMSRLGIESGRSRRIDALRARAAAATADDDIAVLQFALHNELDASNDVDGAWAALELACRAKRRRVHYDAASTTELVDRLIARPAGEPVETATATPTPLFIIGMHRSGTTLLEDRLDRHAGVRGLGELYDFTQCMRFAADHHCRGVTDAMIVSRAVADDLARVGQDYRASVRHRAGDASFTVDKLPSNFLHAGYICEALPDARLLHMRREPMETCFSNLRELFSDACPYSYDMLELGHYYREYERLMAHWRRAYPGRLLDVDYRALVAETDATMRTVAEFCGFDDLGGEDEGAGRRRGVATASAVQVRGAIALPPAPKWTRYARWLSPLQEALGAG